jgi:hypothetical protein
MNSFERALARHARESHHGRLLAYWTAGWFVVGALVGYVAR